MVIYYTHPAPRDHILHPPHVSFQNAKCARGLLRSPDRECSRQIYTINYLNSISLVPFSSNGDGSSRFYHRLCCPGPFADCHRQCACPGAILLRLSLNSSHYLVLHYIIPPPRRVCSIRRHVVKAVPCAVPPPAVNGDAFPADPSWHGCIRIPRERELRATESA